MTRKKSEQTVVDLFCGVGGFSLGAARAGFKLVGSVDWDKDAMRMHQINFPGFNHWLTDITKIDGEDLRKYFTFEQVDGVIGGPPCQGFSRMGHQRVDDARNNLFVKFFSLVAELKPKFFLAENVLGLMDEKNRPLVDRALDFVRNDYSVLDPIVLKASDFGVPTSRTRVFFFGYKKSLGLCVTKAEILKGMPSSKKVKVSDALVGLPIRIHAKNSTANLNGWRTLSGTFYPKGFY